jgi:sec-independent protein translocase protein TatA
LKIDNWKLKINIKEFSMFGNIGWPELLVLAVVLFVLFGSRQLPKVARNVGTSGKDLKHATQEFTQAVKSN